MRTHVRGGNAACLSDGEVGVDTMPLLLAIEPDARQAACLTALVAAHLTAELVLASSVDAGLAALHQRRPDLVLCASSFSDADLGALTAGLSTGHEQQPGVPTLAIPPLTGTTSPATGGLLARLRRPRRRRGAQDCDPASFAAQITECLALADAVRRADAHATTGDSPDATSRLRESDASTVAIDLQVIGEPERADDPVVDAAWLDLEPYLDDEARPVVRTEAGAAEGVPESDVIELPPPDELWAQLAPGYAARMAPLEGPSMTPGPLRAATHARDAEFETTEGASSSLWLVPVPSGSDRPKQDEWGLYDPEQCGFAALLVRLDELADDDRRDRERSNRSAIMRR